MIKKCHYDVILWGGFGSTKCDPNLTSHLRRFFAGYSGILTLKPLYKVKQTITGLGIANDCSHTDWNCMPTCTSHVLYRTKFNDTH